MKCFRGTMVPRVLVLAFTLLCVLPISGCINSAAARNSTPDKAVPLSGIPQDAALEYTYTSNAVYGISVTTDIWNHLEDTGYFVLEFLCVSGRMGQVELRRSTGEAVASFGDIQESTVFITDMVTQAEGDYHLYFEKADYYDGEINVYFVSGIGYSLAG